MAWKFLPSSLLKKKKEKLFCLCKMQVRVKNFTTWSLRKVFSKLLILMSFSFTCYFFHNPQNEIRLLISRLMNFWYKHSLHGLLLYFILFHLCLYFLSLHQKRISKQLFKQKTFAVHAEVSEWMGEWEIWMEKFNLMLFRLRGKRECCGRFVMKMLSCLVFKVLAHFLYGNLTVFLYGEVWNY